LQNNLPNSIPLPCFLDISFNIQHEEFGTIRTLSINNEHWFVGKDVAEILQYHDVSGLRKIVYAEDRQDIDPQNGLFTGDVQNGRTLEPNKNVRRMLIINESGLYQAIFGSKLPKAKEFKRWVTSEVLPSIRNQKFYLKRIYPYNRNMPFFFIQEHWKHDYFTSRLVLV